MEFYQVVEIVNFKDRKVNVRVSYDASKEYLPFIHIIGMANPTTKPDDWDAVYVLADNWIEYGYWREMTFKEFCYKLFPDDENISDDSK